MTAPQEKPFEIGQGNNRPVYEVTIYDYYGTPKQKRTDLTNAISVSMKMRRRGETELVVDEDMEIDDDPTTGKLTYEWQTGDTDDIGNYDVRFEITWADGGTETVPRKPKTVTVFDDQDA